MAFDVQNNNADGSGKICSETNDSS